MAKQNEYGKELDALRTVLNALSALDNAQQQFVLRTSIERLGLGNAASGGMGVGGQAASGGASGGAAQHGLAAGRKPAAGNGVVTAQQFMKDKKPVNEVQRVASLAYFLTHFEDMPDFKTADITALNTRARGLTLSNPARAVDNATRSAKVLGAAKGGRKQITTHGEELVDALPDQDAVKQVLASFKTTIRRPSARKKAAKRKKGS